jgi:serine/threonine protein kinase
MSWQAGRDFLMQCFQKDPNLRVSARKLLRHAWIVGSRRSDAPVAKPPANFDDAVEEVKQWNEALKSPNNGSLRTSTRSSVNSPLPVRRDPPLRNVHNEQQPTVLSTPAKGPLILAKPRNPAEAFRSPETTGDDNWDDDFATSISPSALHQLPHLKPHDNFGGLFSSDRLKSYASVELSAYSQSENWDENFEGDLVTIKGPLKTFEPDSQELETIRPSPKKLQLSTDVKQLVAPNTHNRKQSVSTFANLKDSAKPKAESKFTLPSRPAALFREESVEDYSDLFIENDSVFDRRLNLVKVC